MVLGRSVNHAMHALHLVGLRGYASSCKVFQATGCWINSIAADAQILWLSCLALVEARCAKQ
jgi:hypothetical protein